MSKIDWDGSGLPPVGCQCEIDPTVEHHEYYARHAGRQALIVAHDVGRYGDPIAVYRVVADDGYNEYHGLTSGKNNFRPIRTPEQIAAEEREKAVVEMKRVWSGSENSPFYALYDAGYRKQEPKP